MNAETQDEPKWEPKVMLNATPNALRKLATLIEKGFSFDRTALAESLRLCADAWEKKATQGGGHGA